jgi:hypothetical protein
VRNPYFWIRSMSWDSCFLLSSVVQFNSVSKNVTRLQCSSIILESLSTSVLQSTRATTTQQSFTKCWFFFTITIIRMSSTSWGRKLEWRSPLIASCLYTYTQTYFFVKTQHSWKCHMARKNVSFSKCKEGWLELVSRGNFRQLQLFSNFKCILED